MRILLSTVFILSFMAMTPMTVHAQDAGDEQRTAGAQPEIDNDYSDTYKQLDLFGVVFERVRAQYVEEVPDKDLIE